MLSSGKSAYSSVLAVGCQKAILGLVLHFLSDRTIAAILSRPGLSQLVAWTARRGRVDRRSSGARAPEDKD